MQPVLYASMCIQQNKYLTTQYCREPQATTCGHIVNHNTMVKYLTQSFNVWVMLWCTHQCSVLTSKKKYCELLELSQYMGLSMERAWSYIC